ncbi:hypothetical protein ACHAWF_001609 [Thalassiosira exigua]
MRHAIRARSVLLILLIFGESLMVALHVWILLGILLPSADAMRAQPAASRYAYLLSDASLPIIAVVFASSPSSRKGRTKESLSLLISVTTVIAGALIAAHTALYAAFAWDETNMEGVMAWAYAPWSDRTTVLPPLPGAAVCLDAFCHGWGLISLLMLRLPPQTESGISDAQSASRAACTAGVAVGACIMAYISR